MLAKGALNFYLLRNESHRVIISKSGASMSEFSGSFIEAITQYGIGKRLSAEAEGNMPIKGSLDLSG